MDIRIRGASEHNLRAVDLDLPVGALVVLAGVSGSGKSSLAFDTLHAEGQRRYLEALGLERGVAVLQPPRVDRIEGLPPTVGLAQRAAAPSPRSTVASITGLGPVLRVLFGRCGTLHCPVCDRAVQPMTHDAMVARLEALPKGSRLTLESPLSGGEEAVLAEVDRAGFSRIRLDGHIVRLDEVRPAQLAAADEVRVVVDRLKVDPDRRGRLADSVRLAARAGGGVVVAVTDAATVFLVDRPLCLHDATRLPALEPRLLSAAQFPGRCEACAGSGRVEDGPCGDCGGARLSAVARSVRWRGHTLPELLSLPVAGLATALRAVSHDEVEAGPLRDITARLDQLVDLDLAGLTLSRGADRLSAGERQRLRLARQVGGSLAGVLYVLDEPAAGLDSVLVEAVARLLRRLVDAGNTVVAVEHHAAVIRAADHVVEFGPGPGRLGGSVVFQGTVSALEQADTATSRWVFGRETLTGPSADRPDRGTAVLSGAWRHGAPGPAVSLRRGAWVAVSGPSGSGKTAMLGAIEGALSEGGQPGVTLSGADGLQRAVVIGRGAARVPRSSPATYLGIWDVLRELLAATREGRIRGLNAGTFSLNTRGGRCEACRGTGERVVSLGPLPDVVQSCPVCGGRRFEADVLDVRWKGLDASELLALPASDARTLLGGHPRLDALLRAMVRVGLGYVPLGQPNHTLSGGEARRLALARELARAARRGAEDTVYLLDEPGTGLHPADVEQLVKLLRELCDDGATVWMATSDPALAAAADSTAPLPVDRSADNPVEIAVDRPI